MWRNWLDLVSFLNIAEWGEEKEQSGDASSESSDLEKVAAGLRDDA